MGIKHLAQLIAESAPDAVKTGEIKNQFGRKVAIVSVRSSFRLKKMSNVFRMRMIPPLTVLCPNLHFH